MYDAYGLHILTTSRCKNPMKQRSTSFSDSLKLRERNFKLEMDHRKSTMFSIPEKHIEYLHIIISILEYYTTTKYIHTNFILNYYTLQSIHYGKCHLDHTPQQSTSYNPNQNDTLFNLIDNAILTRLNHSIYTLFDGIFINKLS